MTANPHSRAPLDARATSALEALARQGRARRCPEISDEHGVQYSLDGQPVTGFCSNDYLGLARTRASRAPLQRSPGASASQLICGRKAVHGRVENRIAQMVGSDDAVLFASAYQANLGVLPLVLRAGDHVFSDRLNHASLIEGTRAARSETQILDHLAPPPALQRGVDAWWITESVFSMDGTRPAAQDMKAFRDAGGMLYLDDAHAFGLGPGGAGRNADLARAADITVIGLGKAVGCAGGVVAASHSVCQWIRSACRSFVFSTALSPSIAGEIEGALTRIAGDEGDELRARLRANIHRLRQALGREELGHIVPLWVGDNQRALAWSQALRARGFHVQAIRPPTVPEHGARLRLTLSAAHSEAQINRLLEALEQSAEQLGITWPPPHVGDTHDHATPPQA